MAFRVSWNALSDVARAIGADPTAALLYPIVVDGLMALALIATLVLTGPDREFALRVLATYTIASLLLNYVHGLIPTLHTESTTDRHRTDAEVLAEGRRLTADWSDGQLTAKRLRSELRIAQTRARTMRDQLRAERASRPEPGADEGFEGEPLDIHDDATIQQQREPATVPSSTT